MLAVGTVARVSPAENTATVLGYQPSPPLFPRAKGHLRSCRISVRANTDVGKAVYVA
jgi:hypothetical protein